MVTIQTRLTFNIQLRTDTTPMKSHSKTQQYQNVAITFHITRNNTRSLIIHKSTCILLRMREAIRYALAAIR